MLTSDQINCHNITEKLEVEKFIGGGEFCSSSKYFRQYNVRIQWALQTLLQTKDLL